MPEAEQGRRERIRRRAGDTLTAAQAGRVRYKLERNRPFFSSWSSSLDGPSQPVFVPWTDATIHAEQGLLSPHLRGAGYREDAAAASSFAFKMEYLLDYSATLLFLLLAWLTYLILPKGFRKAYCRANRKRYMKYEYYSKLVALAAQQQQQSKPYRRSTSPSRRKHHNNNSNYDKRRDPNISLLSSSPPPNAPGPAAVDLSIPRIHRSAIVSTSSSGVESSSSAWDTSRDDDEEEYDTQEENSQLLLGTNHNDDKNAATADASFSTLSAEASVVSSSVLSPERIHPTAAASSTTTDDRRRLLLQELAEARQEKSPDRSSPRLHQSRSPNHTRLVRTPDHHRVMSHGTTPPNNSNRFLPTDSPTNTGTTLVSPPLERRTTSPHRSQMVREVDHSLLPLPSKRGTKPPSPEHPDIDQVPDANILSQTMSRLRLRGLRLLAHGNQCDPKRIWLQLDPETMSLTWQTEFSRPITNQSGEVSHVLMRGGKHTIALPNVVYIDVGKRTAALKRADPRVAAPTLCFSLLTASGSLDLQASSRLERDALVSCLCLVLDQVHTDTDWRRLYQTSPEPSHVDETTTMTRMATTNVVATTNSVARRAVGTTVSAQYMPTNTGWDEGEMTNDSTTGSDSYITSSIDQTTGLASI